MPSTYALCPAAFVTRIPQFASRPDYRPRSPPEARFHMSTIQQNDLPKMNSFNRVLGVIRPTSEIIGNYTRTGEVGILATSGTVLSESYIIEIQKFFPSINVFQEACPMWVPLVENNEHNSDGADYFVRKHMQNIFSHSKNIDTLLLACTHYPLLKEKIEKHLPGNVKLVSQGEIVADSLKDYLHRHVEIETKISKTCKRLFYTTDSTEDFNNKATIFFGGTVEAMHLDI